MIATTSTILLSAGAGFALARVLDWIDWRRTRKGRFYE